MHAPIHHRLRDAAGALSDQRVNLQSLADAHGHAALGSLLVLLAAACSTPVSGAGMVLGFGIAALCAALWQGRESVRLPSRIGALQMPTAWARRVLLALARLYGFFGRWSRPRWAWVEHNWTRRWLAAKAMVMAVIVILPIPMGNIAPSIALVLLGLGLVFRDGIVMLASALASWIALAATGAIVALGWHALVAVLPAWARL